MDSRPLPPRDEDESPGLLRLLAALRVADESAAIVPKTGKARFCTSAACLCGSEAVIGGHRFAFGGHVDVPRSDEDAARAARRVLDAACSCCRLLRRKERKAAARAPRPCHGCGSTSHLSRSCHMGATPARKDSFLRCSRSCFARRFVTPLHRAVTTFDADGDLRAGRVDVAARLVTASLVASQRTRHNSQLWMPFLGDAAAPTTVVVSGGPARGLHPSQSAGAGTL